MRETDVLREEVMAEVVVECGVGLDGADKPPHRHLGTMLQIAGRLDPGCARQLDTPCAGKEAEDALGVPHHIVSVQGNNWTSSIAHYDAAPLSFDNVVYEVHGYPPTPSYLPVASGASPAGATPRA